ncbi:MAG: PLD nuclease N-terminal domain-containing protein [Planctomycetota bacterium]
MPWYVLSGVYLIIWSALLVHCLLQRQFYPVFGRRRGTKIFWLLTFIFLNPLLTFLYFVFGFLLRPAKGAPPGKPVGFASVAAIAFVAFVLAFFEWPFPDHRQEPVILSRQAAEMKAQEPNESLRGLEAPWGQAHVVLVKAKNGVQTIGSTSAESDDRASVRSIVLVCQSPHALLDRATREFQKVLIGFADVEKVEYYPYGTWPEPGGPLPDIFITMDMLELHEKAFLCNRRLRAVIQWQVSDTLFPGSARTNHANAPPTVTFNMESRLDHDSTMMGIESPRSVYKVEADGIAAEMAKSVGKQFANLLDKYGQLPRVPAALYGTYREPLEFSFLKDNKAERLISASGLFEDNHTIWRFVEQRRMDEALTAYRDQLQAAGWGAEVFAKDSLQMQKENERIYIFRDRRRDPAAGAVESGEPGKPAEHVAGKPSSNVMIAHYESYFTGDRIQKAMDAWLESETQTKTLLAFERCFRTPEQAERLRAAIEASPLCTLGGSLMLGRYWADRGQTDKARESLMRARAMQRAEKQRDAKSRVIRALAKRLGDESLAETAVSEQVFCEVGFVNAGQLGGPLELERALDEPVLLYRRLDDGRLRTVALRVVHSRDVSSPAPYGLLAVDRRERRSNASETAGRTEPDGSWVADFSLQGAAGENESMMATVKSVGDERFLFVVHP